MTRITYYVFLRKIELYLSSHVITMNKAFFSSLHQFIHICLYFCFSKLLKCTRFFSCPSFVISLSSVVIVTFCAGYSGSFKHIATLSTWFLNTFLDIETCRFNIVKAIVKHQFIMSMFLDSRFFSSPLILKAVSRVNQKFYLQV